jgi:hypothetical protein
MICIIKLTNFYGRLGVLPSVGITHVYYLTCIPYINSHGWQQINIRASEVIAQTSFRKTTIVGGILEAVGRTFAFGEVSFKTAL